MTVCGLLTFTSPRSMEIEVIVEYEPVIGSMQSAQVSASCRTKAVDAFFTFVAIDGTGKAAAVPSLVVNVLLVCRLHRCLSV